MGVLSGTKDVFKVLRGLSTQRVRVTRPRNRATPDLVQGVRAPPCQHALREKRRLSGETESFCPTATAPHSRSGKAGHAASEVRPDSRATRRIGGRPRRRVCLMWRAGSWPNWRRRPSRRLAEMEGGLLACGSRPQDGASARSSLPQVQHQGRRLREPHRRNRRAEIARLPGGARR